MPPEYLLEEELPGMDILSTQQKQALLAVIDPNFLIGTILGVRENLERLQVRLSIGSDPRIRIFTHRGAPGTIGQGSLSYVSCRAEDILDELERLMRGMVPHHSTEPSPSAKKVLSKITDVKEKISI